MGVAEARRLVSLGIRPPDRRTVARYRAAGFTVESAWPWMQMAIAPRQAWAFCQRGIPPEEAAAYILGGITAAQARRIRAVGPDRSGVGRQFVRPARVAWTPGELRPLSVAELRCVLTQDLWVEPPCNTPTALRDQILAEQARQSRRGTIYWITHGVDQVILYEHSAARRACRLVAALASIACWGDLAHLVKREDPAGEEALEYVWDECCGEFGNEDLGIPDGFDPQESRIASGRALLGVVPPETPLHVANRTEDGGFRFIDPYDPLQMGVPRLAIDRHAVERLDAAGYRNVVLERHLDFVRNTLAALGWRLSRGREEDLAPLT
jgi:hypothetical protein